MDSCCKIAYDNTFSKRLARLELKSYLKKGPKKTTNYLLEPLKEHDISGSSLLDIGGGVGVVCWELYKRGLGKIYYQDISEAYAAVFKDELSAQNLEDKIEVHIGDYVATHSQFPQVDLVTLDKVICCYEDYQSLVTLSANKARKYYAYTLPLDVWWVKAVSSLGTFFRKLFGNKIATYVHPVARVESIVLAQGFTKVYQKQHREWLTVLYQK